jgi:predicted RNA-binding Zn-ribbon protein involved in translation (DUF1610 family)
MTKPKRHSVVDSYQTVSVNCKKCGERLFRYKKKNGTKSNLVKCYVEGICEDSAGLLAKNEQSEKEQGFLWHCPSCGTNFVRSATIDGRPALKTQTGGWQGAHDKKVEPNIDVECTRFFFILLSFK